MLGLGNSDVRPSGSIIGYYSVIHTLLLSFVRDRIHTTLTHCTVNIYATESIVTTFRRSFRY